MSEFWSVVAGVVTICGVAGTSYGIGFSKGASKTRIKLNNDRRKARFEKIYAPAFALFLTRHITTASGALTPHFRQRFREAAKALKQGRFLFACRALVDKQYLEELGEVEYGKPFPLSEITALVNNHSRFADSRLGLLVEKANRAKYEEPNPDRLLTNAELKLFYHVVHEYQLLSREFTGV